MVPGDRIALLLPNHPHLVLGWFAIQRLGAVAVPLAFSSTPAQRDAQLADAGVRLLLTTAELADEIAPGTAPGLEQVRVIEADRASAPRPQHRDVSAATPAAILYTSGTTGEQKGVTLSHGALRFNSEATVNALRLRPDDRILACLPLSHSFSITAAVNTAFEACATLVLLPDFDPAQAAATIAAEQISVLPAVPPVFRILLDTADPEQLRSLRVCLSAAIRLPDATREGWSARFGSLINEAYGTTETSMICFNHPLLYRPGAVGTPLTGIEVAIVDDDGGPCRPGTVGEVRVRAPSLMLGYWGRDQATAEAIADGWYRTGDLGYLDDDGYLFLTDRRGDLINTGGRKVLPSDVEQVLLAHPGVVDAAVFAGANALLGEEVRAAVVLAPGLSPGLPPGLSKQREALLEHCRDRLPDWQQPRRIHVLDALPRARSGKILKRELRALAATDAFDAGQSLGSGPAASPLPGADSAETAPAAAAAISAAIKAAITGILGREPEPDADLHALGLTSMKATELAAALEAIVGRSLPVTIAFQHPSLAALTQHLSGALGDLPSRQASLQALSDAALAAAPQIDVYARLPFVHTPTSTPR
jgi:long-chain acyl-CoA synthetase